MEEHAVSTVSGEAAIIYYFSGAQNQPNNQLAVSFYSVG